MNTKDLLIGGGVIALGLWAYKKFVTGSNLIFVPLGISTGGSGLQVKIGVQNPTNESLMFSSLAGNVIVNNVAVANVSNFQGITIPANSQTAVTIDVAVNWLGLGLSAASVVQAGFTGAKLVGTANVNGVALPVNITF